MNMPEGAEMRFAQKVMLDILAENVQRADDIFSGHYYCNGSRAKSKHWRDHVEEMKTGDDWNLWKTGFTWRSMRLNRGPNFYNLKLTAAEKKAMHICWLGLERERLENERLAKIARNQAVERAEWWP